MIPKAPRIIGSFRRPTGRGSQGLPVRARRMHNAVLPNANSSAFSISNKSTHVPNAFRIPSFLFDPSLHSGASHRVWLDAGGPPDARLPAGKVDRPAVQMLGGEADHSYVLTGTVLGLLDDISEGQILGLHTVRRAALKNFIDDIGIDQRELRILFNNGEGGQRSFDDVARLMNDRYMLDIYNILPLTSSEARFVADNLLKYVLRDIPSIPSAEQRDILFNKFHRMAAAFFSHEDIVALRETEPLDMPGAVASMFGVADIVVRSSTVLVDMLGRTLETFRSAYADPLLVEDHETFTQIRDMLVSAVLFDQRLFGLLSDVNSAEPRLSELVSLFLWRHDFREIPVSYFRENEHYRALQGIVKNLSFLSASADDFAGTMKMIESISAMNEIEDVDPQNMSTFGYAALQLEGWPTDVLTEVLPIMEKDPEAAYTLLHFLFKNGLKRPDTLEDDDDYMVPEQLVFLVDGLQSVKTDPGRSNANADQAGKLFDASIGISREIVRMFAAGDELNMAMSVMNGLLSLPLPLQRALCAIGSEAVRMTVMWKLGFIDPVLLSLKHPTRPSRVTPDSQLD